MARFNTKDFFQVNDETYFDFYGTFKLAVSYACDADKVHIKGINLLKKLDKRLEKLYKLSVKSFNQIKAQNVTDLELLNIDDSIYDDMRRMLCEIRSDLVKLLQQVQELSLIGERHVNECTLFIIQCLVYFSDENIVYSENDIPTRWLEGWYKLLFDNYLDESVSTLSDEIEKANQTLALIGAILVI